MCSTPRKCFSEYLYETSYKELEKKVYAFRPKTQKRQFAVDPLKVTNLKIDTFLGMKAIRFIANIDSDSGKKYKVTMQFRGVNFEDGGLEFTASDGKEYTINPFKLNEHDVYVRCQCADFYYRFGWYNHQDKSIYGPRPKPYKRKTDWYPPANPDKVPGFCKHIIATVRALEDAGFVQKA